jgi:hypothetical protein
MEINSTPAAIRWSIRIYRCGESNDVDGMFTVIILTRRA